MFLYKLFRNPHAKSGALLAFGGKEGLKQFFLAAGGIPEQLSATRIRMPFLSVRRSPALGTVWRVNDCLEPARGDESQLKRGAPGHLRGRTAFTESMRGSGKLVPRRGLSLEPLRVQSGEHTREQPCLNLPTCDLRNALGNR